VLAPLAYGAPLDHYLHAFKYRGARALGRALGLLLAPSLRPAAVRLDGLVPVPLHRARLRERGYNQAREIARTLGRELELPLVERGIVRRRAGEAQARQGAAQRRAGIARAFAVTRNCSGRRLAIVDDVITTGATVNALAAELLAAGARVCVAVAVARTGERALGGDASAAERIVEDYPCEHGAAEPRIVEECTEGLDDIAVLDEIGLVQREQRGDSQPAVVPEAELRAAADENEADEQQRLKPRDECAIEVAEQNGR
jgi:ComF family protein